PPPGPVPVPTPGYPPVSVPPPTPYPPAYPTAGAVSGRLIVQATNAVLPFPPGKSEILIGREDPVSNVFPDIDLTPHGGDEGGVSRRHARIFAQGNQVFIEDLNSTNYTYVNQQKLMPGQPYPLKDGDEVRLGKVRLTYMA
ncbi:MAG: FHA domain-containing protein, partial [Anaerolineae bacterium]